MTQTDFDSLNNLSPGQHRYQFYKSEDDYVESMSRFFRAGLEKGDACLWLASEKMGLERISGLLETLIPNFLFYLSAGQFQIRSAEEWYLRDGYFSEEQALANAANYMEYVQKIGFNRLRGAGDASAIPRAEWPKLKSYEKKVDEIIKSSPIMAVCAYPILECTLQDTKMVLDCHDGVLSGKL